MANIKNHLNNIKNAMFGKDVRNSIHDAIKQCYDDASVNNDNANMEVKLARGVHNTLNDRLSESDKKQKELSSQLEHKANNTSIKNLQTQIDNLVIESGGDSNLEVTQSRCNVFGDEFVTLKSHLDNIEKNTLVLEKINCDEEQNGYWHYQNGYTDNEGFIYQIYNVSNLSHIYLETIESRYVSTYVTLDSEKKLLTQSIYTGLENEIKKNIDVSNACFFGVSVAYENINALSVKTVTNKLNYDVNLNKENIGKIKSERKKINLIETNRGFGFWHHENDIFTENTGFTFIEYDVKNLNVVNLYANRSKYVDLFVLLDENKNIISKCVYDGTTDIFNDEIDVSKASYLLVSVLNEFEKDVLCTSNINTTYRSVDGDNFYTDKNIVWFGTSIPAGGKEGYNNLKSYPHRVGNLLGCNIVNEAIGSSTVHCKKPTLISDDNPYGFISDFEKVSRCLTNTLEEVEWIINNYNSSIFTNNTLSSLSEDDKEFIRNCSYERKLNKYLNESNMPDLFVFDHGFNDFDNDSEEDEQNYNTYGEFNLYCYRGAMNFLIQKIKDFRPHARIVMIGNYENQKRKVVSENQLIVANDWSIPIFKQWELYGWSQRSFETRGYWRHGYWRDPAPEYDLRTMNYLSLWLPDGVHPHTDYSGKTQQFMANHISKWLKNIIS